MEDVVSAAMLALTQNNAVGEVFNISTGKATTINKLVAVLQKITGKTNLKSIYEAPSYASIDKARRRVGYEAVFPLEEGLKRLME